MSTSPNKAAQAVAKRLSEIPNVDISTARFVEANDDGTVLVDFGEGTTTIYSAGFYVPMPGEFVRTVRVDALVLMLGPAKPRSSYGLVTATGSPNLTILLPTGETVSLPRVISAYPSPAVNDNVLISWADGGIVVGKVSAVPVSNYDIDPILQPPPASAARKPFEMEFRAVDSGNFWLGGNSWNSLDVWSSPSNTGAWFYGDIAGSIPDTATISLVQVYVNEFYNQFPSNLAGIGLHSATSKSGNPGVSSVVDISAGSGWKTLPNSFGDALKTGAAKGLGTPARTGYHKFRSRAADAQSGLLRITGIF